MSCETDPFSERLLGCLDENDDLRSDLNTWTDSLEELSEIVDSFEVDEKNKLQGKTILDIGTDCVKPLYIALKFEPKKVIGISEDLSPYSFASDIEQKSKLLTETKIHFYNCSVFDEENLKKIKKREEVKSFDYVLLSKTLHHLRTGEDCVAIKRDPKHECGEDEDCCIYEFKAEEIFKLLLQHGERVIVSEAFYPQEEDDDKVRGRGGYFTANEWKQIFEHLSEKFSVQFIKPMKFRLAHGKMGKVKSMLRKMDYVCFYVEADEPED